MAQSVPYSGTYCRYGRTTPNTLRKDATMRASVSGRWMGDWMCSDSTPPGVSLLRQAA